MTHQPSLDRHDDTSQRHALLRLAASALVALLVLGAAGVMLPLA